MEQRVKKGRQSKNLTMGSSTRGVNYGLEIHKTVLVWV